MHTCIVALTHAATHTQHTRQVHYTGTLSDGTVFDSSFSRGEPTEFKLGSVIQGWQEGLQLMKVGGKARLVIPAGLAYGDKQMNTIPPNSELTFEVRVRAWVRVRVRVRVGARVRVRVRVRVRNTIPPNSELGRGRARLEG